jgi:MFS family permease
MFLLLQWRWINGGQTPSRSYSVSDNAQLGGLITFAIGQLNGFPVWRAVFLICGGVTVLWGGILLLFLPNSILSAKRFTIEEKILLIGRGKQNQTVPPASVYDAESVLILAGHPQPQDKVVSDPRGSHRSPSLAAVPLRLVQ